MSGATSGGAQAGSAADPSMEDILASIRRILSEEDPPAGEPPASVEPRQQAPAQEMGDVLILDESMLVADAPPVVARSPAPPPPPMLLPPAMDEPMRAEAEDAPHVVPPAVLSEPDAEPIPEPSPAEPIFAAQEWVEPEVIPVAEVEQPAPVYAEPDVEMAPVEMAPVEMAPVEMAPVEMAHVETTPVEMAPVEAAPVEDAVPEPAMALLEIHRMEPPIASDAMPALTSPELDPPANAMPARFPPSPVPGGPLGGPVLVPVPPGASTPLMRRPAASSIRDPALMLAPRPPQEDPTEPPPPITHPDPESPPMSASLSMPNLASPETTMAAASSVTNLVRALSSDRSTQVHSGGPTIADLVREEIRPLLKEWLDSHLPPLVERLVRAEIERVLSRASV